MSKNHNLRTHPKYFKEIKYGKKRFELRKNDRDFRAGDTITLHEFDPDINDYTGEICIGIVDYVMRFSKEVEIFGLKEGYCIMNFTLL